MSSVKYREVYVNIDFLIEEKNLEEAASWALEKNLYIKHPNYCLKFILHSIKEGIDVRYKKFVFASIGDTPVGLFMVRDDKYCICFVKKEYRRKQIGTLLRQKAIGDSEDYFAHEGTKGSHSFWKNNGIEVRP